MPKSWVWRYCSTKHIPEWSHDIKMLLDAAVGGTMMTLDVEQATIIIDALASTDYKAQHDGQDLHNKGLLEDAPLAKNKILTQQLSN